MKMVLDRVSQICSTGSAFGVMLEWNKCENPYDSDCQKCDGLEEVVFSCQQDGSCPACNDWADNLVSLAPTVTPATVKPPTFEGEYILYLKTRPYYLLKSLPSCSSFL